MKTFCLSLLIIILSANTYSQKGFYLHPIIENKFHINPGHSYDVTTLQGYTIHVSPLNFYNYFKGFDIGIHIGYRTKNFFFETGWSSDQANAGARITAAGSLVDSIHFINEITTSMGIVYNKYPFRIGIKLFGRDSITIGRSVRWQGFLYGGIDFLRRPGSGVVQGDGYDFIINSKQEYVRFETISENTNETRSVLNTMGFILKAYNKKGRNILSLGLHFSRGHNHILAYNSMKFTNYDGIIYYGLGLVSKGSGLYITFSKDIYPINFFKKNKTTSKFLLNKN